MNGNEYDTEGIYNLLMHVKRAISRFRIAVSFSPSILLLSTTNNPGNASAFLCLSTEALISGPATSHSYPPIHSLMWPSTVVGKMLASRTIGRSDAWSKVVRVFNDHSLLSQVTYLRKEMRFWGTSPTLTSSNSRDSRWECRWVMERIERERISASKISSLMLDSSAVSLYWFDLASV